MTKTITFLLFLFIGSPFLCAQNTWVQRPDYPGIARESAVSFVIGTKGYVGTGSTIAAGYRRDFWSWDQQTNTWMQIADFGGTARAGAVGFEIDGKGYVGTGIDTTGTQDFWQYDPIGNSWTRKADFPGGPRTAAVGFASQNPKAGFIGTGIHNATLFADLWQYDPQTDSWIQKTSMPAPRASATAFFLAGKGYIATGITSTASVSTDFWEWDLATDTWTQRISMPLPAEPRQSATSFAMNGKGYIATGRSWASETNDFWEWDPATDSWSQLANVGTLTRSQATGFVIGNAAYVCGGDNMANLFLADFWEYSNTTGVEELSTISISLFPVPAIDQLTVTFPTGLSKTVITISNISGKCVYASEASVSGTQKINIESLADGVYVFEIRSEKGFVREKFLKLPE